MNMTAIIAVVGLSSTLAAAPVGWRTDGTGRYLAAEPPTTWSAQENVAWKVKLPGKSNGSPIVVGERIFVVSDPAEVLCLNAADGEIVWRKRVIGPMPGNNPKNVGDIDAPYASRLDW